METYNIQTIVRALNQPPHNLNLTLVSRRDHEGVIDRFGRYLKCIVYSLLSTTNLTT